MTPVLSPAARAHRALNREQSPGLDLALVHRARVRELHLTLRPLPGETIPDTLQRLHRVLREHDATPVRQDIFGSLAAHHGTLKLMNWLFGNVSWPVTWVEGADCFGGRIAGMHVLAVAGAEPEPLHLDGRLIGCVYHDGAARHCLLGGVGPRDVTLSRGFQTGQAYEALEVALASVGLDLSHLVRTWFFLDDILGWYGDFNEVRNEVYVQRRLLQGLVPASTGVGARNPAGAALVAGAWAMQPINGAVVARAVPSPLQCPAPTYGSCFNRAVELDTPDHRHLLVSGTASIAPEGQTAHVGDVAGQIELTMRVIEAILRSRGLGFADATRATAYFKDPADASAFTDWCARNELTCLPALVAQSYVCRHDLLFELELDALAPQRRGAGAAVHRATHEQASAPPVVPIGDEVCT
jgi:enamine deaminase RidA (YjgF/YER057c/UK114 family)